MSRLAIPSQILGTFTEKNSGTSADLVDPASGHSLAQVIVLESSDVRSAVEVARNAVNPWKGSPTQVRTITVRRLANLLLDHSKDLMQACAQELGKMTEEASIEVDRSAESIEWGIIHAITGGQVAELPGGKAHTTDVFQAIGIVAIINPCDLSGLLALLALALTLGNCVIIKAPTQRALSMHILAELVAQAGFPSGVVQLFFGDRQSEFVLIDHPEVKAIVSHNPNVTDAQRIFKHSIAEHKRVVTLGGGKNYVLALPDCDVAITASDIVAGFTGSAGQRDQAVSVLVLVGDGSEAVHKAFFDTLVHEIVASAGKIEAGQEKGQMGPVADLASRNKIVDYINEAEAAGCKILLDGRSWATERTAGYWAGPTIILHTNPNDRAMKEEIFGPVLSVYCASSWEEAVGIENKCPTAAVSSIYTERGSYAEWFAQRFHAPFVGINECFPPSREPVGVNGMRTALSTHDLSGPNAAAFFTTRTRITARWVAPAVRNGCASPTRSITSPVSAMKSAGNSPMTLRKNIHLSVDQALPPVRRYSSGTTNLFSRENSATTDFSCESEGDATVDHYPEHAPAPPKPTVFHGIAATSPFASSDSHFDFELERLRAREDSFNPCYSVQPSFDADPRVSNPMERGHSDLSAVSGASSGAGSGLSRESSFSLHASRPRHYNVDLYAVDDLPQRHLDAVDNLVTAIGPLESQYKYRASAVRFLKKQLRKALQCNVFETNMIALRAFLPTDPIKLSVVLIGRLEPCWQTLVRDGLLKVQNSATSDADATATSEVKHSIKRIEVIKIGNTNEHKVHCQCDVTDVEITLNSRNDICMLAFLEEVDTLVGQDSLFKRSALLARAWWEYETTDCFESPATRTLLSEFALCVMMCAVFNQYHSRINTPLQALCLFLAEYSAYDGSSQAITLQGIVPFKSPDSHQPVTVEPSKKHLISQSLVEKYWQVFHVDDVVKGKSPTNAANGGVVGPLPPSPTPSVASMTDTTNAFVRDGFNILHPFEGTNMVRAGKSADRKPARLCKAFADGARLLSLALSKQPTAEAGDATGELEAGSNEVIDTLFPISKARFANVTRPDGMVNTDSPTSNGAPTRSSMAVSVDKLWQGIMYCNFIIKSVVSESAILTFCIDVLSMMGLLTADDLGKRLNEASKVPQVMVTLKEQVGGLKEFLKRFPDVFIFSYEHPYNPHVFLRISLTPELQAEVENGVLPVKSLSHIIAKFGRIAPPPPKIDSPGLRRGKMIAQPATQQVPPPPQAHQHSALSLDEKVVFGHERSAGGANTLRLMQSDLDLASVNDPLQPPPPPSSYEGSDSGSSGKGSSGTLHPYAAPFVPQHQLQQQQSTGRGLILGPEKVLPMRKPSNLGATGLQTPPLQTPSLQPLSQPSLRATSPSLTIPGPTASANASLYQDLGLMSNAVLTSGVSLSLAGSGNTANSTGGSTAAAKLFPTSEALDGFLDTKSDYFGDSLSLLGGNDNRSIISGTGSASSLVSGANGSAREGNLDLLLGLRENPKDFRETGLDDFSQELNFNVNPALSANLPARSGPSPSNLSAANYTAPGRGRYPAQQQAPSAELYGEYDTSVPGLDAYYQQGGSGAGKGRGGSDLYGRGGGADDYTGEGYGGGYHQAGGNEPQAGYHYGGHGGQYGPRGPMQRSHSRPLMGPGQQQAMPPGSMGMQPGGQPRFQHKRYDVSQQQMGGKR